MPLDLGLRQTLSQIRHIYRVRKELCEPDLRPWEFFLQMLCSAYLSWRWLGNSARFNPFSRQYWFWLATYSSLSELATRASLADKAARPEPEPPKTIWVGPNQRLIQQDWIKGD
jgi:hypothetical protein